MVRGLALRLGPFSLSEWAGKRGEVARLNKTSEGNVGDHTEQFDLYEPGDREQRARVLTRRAARRYGETELGTSLDLDGRTMRNQLDRRKREDKANSFWKLSEDAVWKLFFSDRQFRAELLALCDEEIADKEVFEPEDFMRDAVALALAGEFGNAGREKILSMQRRVKKARK